ncbi:TLD domain-containing protein mustard isoform X4 [Haemaphysalis longicornis]
MSRVAKRRTRQDYAVYYDNKTQSVDCHGYVNPLELVLDTGKKEEGGRGRTPGGGGGGPLEPLLGPLAAAAAAANAATHHHGGPSADPRRRAATSPGAGGGGARGAAAAPPPFPPAPQSAPPTTTPADVTAGRKQLTRTPTQPPPGALEYVVKASDTLAGIAARFECTPGELTTMNRLTSRLIFPGQTLYIPLRGESQTVDAADAFEPGRLEDDKASAGHRGTGAGPPSPGDRPCSPRVPASPPPDSPLGALEQHRHGSSVEHLDSAEHENKDMDMFLKISSRHITDGQGVVMGTLLVTPNNVMFVPNVSDALVMEHGSECYEVTAPMDMVVAAALYNDITHMHLRDSTALDPLCSVQLEKPYRPADYQPPAETETARGIDIKLQQAALPQGQPASDAQVKPIVQGTEMPVSEPCQREEAAGKESTSDQKTSESGALISISSPTTPLEGDISLACKPGGGSELPGVSVGQPQNKISQNVASETQQMKIVEPVAVGNASSSAEATVQRPASNASQELKAGAKEAEVVKSSAAASESKPSPTEGQKRVDSAVPKAKSSPLRVCSVSVQGESDVQRAVKVVEVEPPSEDKSAEVRQHQLQAGEVGTGEEEANKPTPPGGLQGEAELHSELCSVNAQVLTEGPSDKPAKEAAAPGAKAALETPSPKKDRGLENEKVAAVAKKPERQQTADQYSFRPIEKAPDSSSALRRDPDGRGGSLREKSFTPPPAPSSAKNLPEPGRWSRMLSPTFKVDPSSDTAANTPPNAEAGLRSGSSSESVTLRMREWASAEGGILTEKGPESAHERVLKRLSNPMESISSYTHSISKMIASSPKSLADFSAGIFVRGADEAPPSTPPLQVQPQPAAEEEKRPPSRTENANVWLKNMVEEKPELFAAFEKMGFFFDDNELVPRPAQASEATLLYLCLRMGRPLHKKVQCSISVSAKRRIRPQYWFGIPRNRADELYHFLEKWAPSVYGDVHTVDVAARGFEPLPEPGDDDYDLFMGLGAGVAGGTEEVGGRDTPDAGTGGSKWGHHGSKKGGALRFFKLFDSGAATAPGGAAAVSPGDWEVVSMSEARRESLVDLADLPLPELLDSTEIFTEEHRRELCKHLPARAESYSWALVYSTLKHGFSLKTLYREMLKIESPILLAVLDTEGAVFGVLTSCSLRMSDHFYGTGESFLFTFHPEFKLYKWTGDNVYFIKGNSDSLAFGAGEGQFGLWLDGDLFHGRSHRCKTYENDVLSTKEDFVVKALEAWGFV